jgi:hypothetical protein
VYHARTKRIDMRFHKIRKLVAICELLLEKIHTSDNATNMLTKPIIADKFKHCLDLTYSVPDFNSLIFDIFT